MRRLDPGGFDIHRPQTHKKFRIPLVNLGPHHEWSGDSHDKLAKIGFPVYGICDVWTVSRWLGLWTVPNNRLKLAIAYLWLSLVKQLGGTMSISVDKYTTTHSYDRDAPPNNH